MDGPPRKRPRTEDADLEESSKLHEDSDFWFPDGSIILTAAGVSFRVYSGVLARHSIVFRDMLQFPQPLTAPSVEGCPVLEVSDSPSDLKHLLNVLFPKPTLSPLKPVPTTVQFDHIAALVRLSHKYQMDEILEDSLSYITDYYTMDYQGWLKRDQKPLKVKPSQAIEAVLIARLTQTYTILPPALLQCCFLGQELFRGYTREDGTVAKLLPEDLERCFHGYRRLKQVEGQSIRSLARVVGDGENVVGCVQPTVCRKIMHDFWVGVQAGEVGPGDALKPWTDLLVEFEASRGVKICLRCRRAALGKAKGRFGTWTTLPTFLDLNVPGCQWNPTL
ncbi:hypothetical protein C8Q79DRAFT_920317 [Trametes meyenii]|nr:hypothetical protein C8Q79DRAFT_920317 [Trametes meyenii]